MKGGVLQCSGGGGEGGRGSGGRINMRGSLRSANTKAPAPQGIHQSACEDYHALNSNFTPITHTSSRRGESKS